MTIHDYFDSQDFVLEDVRPIRNGNQSSLFSSNRSPRRPVSPAVPPSRITSAPTVRLNLTKCRSSKHDRAAFLQRPNSVSPACSKRLESSCGSCPIRRSAR